MCGIFCSLLQTNKKENWSCEKRPLIKQQLANRGPDNDDSLIRTLDGNWHLNFTTHVLWLQGDKLHPQPVVDKFNNILLWNGDVFGLRNKKVRDMSDTKLMSENLCDLSSQPEGILEVLGEVEGPWSFIYWNERHHELWFGRDAMGRHSLLWWQTENSPGIVISSTASRVDVPSARELPAVGIFRASISDSGLQFKLHPWNTTCLETVTQLYSPSDLIPNLAICHAKPFLSPYVVSNLDTPHENDEYLNKIRTLFVPDITQFFNNLLEDCEIAQRVQKFSEVLLDSVNTRCKTQPQLCQSCVATRLEEDIPQCSHCKVAVLFSGGLDSAVLALLADSCIPPSEPIDLVNVAFSIQDRAVQTCHSGKDVDTCLRTNPEFDVPDRILSKKTFEELRSLRPNRHWQYVEVNVGKTELKEQRQNRIADLIYPRNSVLDDSLGCALWFAARANGTLHHKNCDVPLRDYSSPARILLLGMGADELLGGYANCRKLLSNSEDWLSVAQTLSRALNALPTRNLGRDDRVVCDSGRQGRFPYLAEGVVNYLASLPAHLRTSPLPCLPPGMGEKLLLRLLAHQLGLCCAAQAPKRALQFGSRLAGLEARNERGDAICPRLLLTV
ncbi:hypothetical protein B566_EDAN017134 [Ephemera danica]|nr:hypothetical protein B566_EDAN017134 [Ephemera danica]